MLDVVLLGGAAVEVLHDGAHRRTAGAVIALDQAIDLRTQPHAQCDRASGGQLDRVQRIRIGRIGHQQGQPVAAFLHGHHMLLLEKAQREFQLGRRQFRRVARGQQRHLQQFGPGLGQVAFGNQPQPRHQRGERTFGGFLVQAPCAAQVGILQPAARDQPGADSGLAVIAHACPATRRLDGCRHPSPHVQCMPDTRRPPTPRGKRHWYHNGARGALPTAKRGRRASDRPPSPPCHQPKPTPTPPDASLPLTAAPKVRLARGDSCRE